MRNNVTAPDEYWSKRNKISRSFYHEGMWIIDTPNGGFYNLTASDEIILKLHPKD